VRRGYYQGVSNEPAALEPTMSTAPKTYATAYDFAFALAQKWLPTGQISYSNQDFDICSSIASAITSADRKHGRPAPAHGYSAENIKIAERAFKAWRDEVAQRGAKFYKRAA
jgi:hypothetical protein